MSEINGNNINNKVVNKTNDVSFRAAKPVEAEPHKAIECSNTDDLSNNPSAVLGRSQVKKVSFSGETKKNIKNDLEVLRNNPELVKKSELAFKGAFKEAQSKGMKDPYSHAVKVQSQFVSEYLKDDEGPYEE